MLYCTLALMSEQPFASIKRAEVSFRKLQHSFTQYKNALDACAPTYDVHVEPGPPFDGYYYLETLHRMLANWTTWMDDARDVWGQMAMTDSS